MRPSNMDNCKYRKNSKKKHGAKKKPGARKKSGARKKEIGPKRAELNTSLSRFLTYGWNSGGPLNRFRRKPVKSASIVNDTESVRSGTSNVNKNVNTIHHPLSTAKSNEINKTSSLNSSTNRITTNEINKNYNTEQTDRFGAGSSSSNNTTNNSNKSYSNSYNRFK
uniref:Uncharacterized protein n=1 Tax=Melicertus latisulcatus majanivirus TaxID=2984277 RepID=A0A9C7F7U5_9VIRU|nr:MAG: hypothetical protein [Melicertus latisulcatus majanivirus]